MNKIKQDSSCQKELQTKVLAVLTPDSTEQEYIDLARKLTESDSSKDTTSIKED